MTLGGESYLNFMGNEFGCALSAWPALQLPRSACLCAAIPQCAEDQLAYHNSYNLRSDTVQAVISRHPEWIDFPRDDTYDTSTGAFVPGALFLLSLQSASSIIMFSTHDDDGFRRHCAAQLETTLAQLLSKLPSHSARYDAKLSSLPQATAAAWTSAGGGGTWQRTRTCGISSCTPSTAP